MVTLERSTINSGNFRGTILVKNICFHKKVFLRYSTDNWQTTRLFKKRHHDRFCYLFTLFFEHILSAMTDQHFGKNQTSIKHVTHLNSTPPSLKPKKSTKFNFVSNSKPKIEIFGKVTRDRTMHFNRLSYPILFSDSLYMVLHYIRGGEM